MFQLTCPVEVRGERRIDKSVLRRNIGRRESIAPGEATVNFIRARLEVAWAVLQASEITHAERQLMSAFASRYDLYNLTGCRAATRPAANPHRWPPNFPVERT